MSVSIKQERIETPGKITVLVHNHVQPCPSLLQHLPEQSCCMLSPENIDHSHYYYVHKYFSFFFDSTHVWVQYTCAHSYKHIYIYVYIQ